MKENHSTSQNRWARTSPRSTFVLQTVRWCTPPPSDRLTCWDEVTFYTERGAICCSFLLISTGNSDRFCCSTMEAKFGRVYPLRTIPWSERGDCRGRQPWIWILICRRSPWWAAKALESHLASTTKMRILLYSENQLMRPLKIGGVGWLVGIVCVSFRVLLGRSGSWWIWGSPMVSFNAERLFSARNSQTHVTLYNGNACHI